MFLQVVDTYTNLYNKVGVQVGVGIKVGVPLRQTYPPLDARPGPRACVRMLA
jgi:hypothetical protein